MTNQPDDNFVVIGSLYINTSKMRRGVYTEIGRTITIAVLSILYLI